MDKGVVRSVGGEPWPAGGRPPTILVHGPQGSRTGRGGTGGFSGTTRIGGKGIEKHFKSTEPPQAIVELVWNGFDAKASRVEVELALNDLKHLESVTVSDNGEGIDFVRIDDNFGRFNESDKVGDAALHGLNGRGRLAFHKLADRAAWFTLFKGEDASIVVEASHLEHYTGNRWEAGESHGKVPGESGTHMLLHPVSRSLPARPVMLNLLAQEFGWHLLLNPGRVLLYDHHPVVAPAHELFERPVFVDEQEFQVRAIRWHERPTSEKSYVYLQNSNGKVVHSELSSHNKKTDFFVSVYAQAGWADKFAAAGDLLAPDAVTADATTWKTVSRLIRRFLQQKHRDFLREHVEKQIRKYEDEGAFPDFKGLSIEDAEWRARNIRTIVRTVYLADPGLLSSLQKKQRSIVFRLLDRLAVSSESDALLDVLGGVLGLDEPALAKFAAQLERSTLESIVETISTLQRRQTTVDQIRELMHSHYNEVRETPDLQKVIELNTWLFGPQFETLGAEETTFTKIARELRVGSRALTPSMPGTWKMKRHWPSHSDSRTCS